MKILKKYTCFENVEVFILGFEENKDSIDYDLIPKEQLAEIDTYRLEKDRLKRLIARTFLFKHAQKHYKLKDFSFEFNERERPQFKDDFPFFSISYSNDLIAVALSSTCKVGVDIEYLNDEMEICETSEFFMHKDELKEFENLKSFDEKLYFFYKLWTYKEAYLKAIGEGFFTDPKTIKYSEKDKSFHELIKIKKLYSLSLHVKD